MTDLPAEHLYRGHLGRLLSRIRDEGGMDLTQYRARYVERRVAVRLNILGIHTYAQYADYLAQHPEEYVELQNALTINVTQFFRDTTVYRLLRETVIPELLRYKQSRRQRLVRVWSAGCATGQEPYSLAMALLDGIQTTRVTEALISVIGTDIDDDALAIARLGEYPIAELAHVPAADRNRFLDVGSETFTLRPEVMKLVHFRHLDVSNDAAVNGVDMIVCRNVFIYFNREDQERMLAAFSKSLNRGGYLVLGRSERMSAPLMTDFVLVDGRERIYRKRDAVR